MTIKEFIYEAFITLSDIVGILSLFAVTFALLYSY